MGERRSKRKERLAEEEVARLGVAAAADAGLRHSLGQRAGEAFRNGDVAMSKVLESALRHRERVERVTHGFHTYPAGLHPDAARDALSLGSGPLLDPFCGGGTVLIEAMLAGRDALGLDVSPVACMVARTRTARTDEAARTALRSLARQATEAALHAPAGIPPGLEVPAEILDWYEPHVIGELVALHDAIGNHDLARAVFSSILVRASQRASDTSNTRSTTSRPPGTAATLFHKKARELGRLLEELEKAVPPGVRARVHREDSRKQRERASFGQVVTSPPYPGVYDYVPMQQLRLAWLGLDPGSSLREEVSPRRAFRADRSRAMAAWRDDTRRWVRGCARALVPGGRMVVIIGDGHVLERKIDSLGPVDEAASAATMKRLACASVERWDEGLRTMRLEHAILFERGAEAPSEERDEPDSEE